MGLFGPPDVASLAARGDIQGLARALGYKKDASVRAAAASALGATADPRAVGPLIAALDDSWQVVRAAAASALGATADPRAVGPLTGALSDFQEGVRSAAADAMGRIGAPAVDSLATYMLRLRSASPDCARALGRIGDPRAIQPLIAALSHESTANDAAAALGTIGPQAVEPLMAVLGDSDRSYGDKRKAAVALGLTGDARAVDLLVRSFHDPWLATEAAAALGRIGDPRAIQSLIEALANTVSGEYALAALVAIGQGAVEPLIYVVDADDGQSRDCPNRFVGVARALGRIGDARAVDPLMRALKSGSAPFDAARALGEIGDRRAWEALVTALPHVSSAAVALVRIDRAAAIEPLVDVLRSGRLSGDEAVAALRLLGPISIEPFIAALTSPDSSVREEAVRGLKACGDKRAIEPLVALQSRAPDSTVADALVALGWQADDSVAAAQFWLARRDFSKAAALGGVAVGPLVEFVGDADMDADKSWSTKCAAIKALGQIVQGNPQPLDCLIKVIHSEPDIRDVAELHRRGIFNASGPVYDSGYDRVRDAARDALVSVGEPAVEPLIREMGTGTFRSQCAFIQALGGLHDPRAIEPLKARLEDPSVGGLVKQVLASL